MDMKLTDADEAVRERAEVFTEHFLYPYEEELDATDRVNPEKEAALRAQGAL